MTPNMLLAPAAPVEPLYIRDDGYVVDIETGEVIRHEDQPEAFAVTSDASANWVLDRMAEADAKLTGLRVEREVRISALNAQFDRREREVERRREWLRWRFWEQLRAYALSALAGGKKRTFSTTAGNLSFRTKPAVTKVDVVDLESAVAWCDDNAPDAVKRSVNVLVGSLKDKADALPTDAFAVTKVEPVEVFTVDTGIEKWG